MSLVIRPAMRLAASVNYSDGDNSELYRKTALDDIFGLCKDFRRINEEYRAAELLGTDGRMSGAVKTKYIKESIKT
jgi:hypothetical protein